VRIIQKSESLPVITASLRPREPAEACGPSIAEDGMLEPVVAPTAILRAPEGLEKLKSPNSPSWRCFFSTARGQTPTSVTTHCFSVGDLGARGELNGNLVAPEGLDKKLMILDNPGKRINVAAMPLFDWQCCSRARCSQLCSKTPGAMDMRACLHVRMFATIDSVCPVCWRVPLSRIVAW
jgi:hypothetical protein